MAEQILEMDGMPCADIYVDGANGYPVVTVKERATGAIVLVQPFNPATGMMFKDEQEAFNWAKDFITIIGYAYCDEQAQTTEETQTTAESTAETTGTSETTTVESTAETTETTEATEAAGATETTETTETSEQTQTTEGTAEENTETSKTTTN